MFRHILIPTDGSALAAKGVKGGVKLAKALAARVTAVYVIAPYVPAIYGEAALYYAPGMSGQEYTTYGMKEARKALAGVERQARAAGVRCATRAVTTAPPYLGILKVARASGCDAIAMASHGRSGLKGLILGSQTSRVLAHSKLPVIVLR
jgi:nucleotide-binding universal stress UspA family protein